jgi:hypothetical protein
LSYENNRPGRLDREAATLPGDADQPGNAGPPALMIVA